MADSESRTHKSRWPWTSEAFRWIIVTLLIPFAGFIWNEVQKHDAERQKEIERVRAEEQMRVQNARGESDIVIRLLPALATPDEGSPVRGIALAVLLNLADRDALSPDLVGAAQVAVDASQQRVRDGTATEPERAALSKLAAATDQLSAARATDGGPSTAAPTSARAFRVEVPRVYIQIFDEKDRRLAEVLQRWIIDEKRWLAPGIENVVATAARANRTPPRGRESADVRYFNEEDRAQAQEIVEWLAGNDVPGMATRVTNLRAPAGQMEVWFPL
jgi:hypothetical protein